MDRVGLIFLDRPSLPEQVRLAKRAEDRGFDSVWVCETRLVRDGITPLAAFATATSRIKLATGVVNNWTRTSALMAMTFATLAELAPGRVILGIGAYWDPLAWKQGVERYRLLTAMREYVDVVRRLLALETVTLEGKVVKVRDLRLDLGGDGPQDPVKVPIYIGATGPQMMTLAGEIADGIFHNFFTSPRFLRDSLKRAEAGAKRGGRSLAEIDMPQMIAVSMSQDAEQARHVARHPLTMYIGQQPHIALASGVDQELVRRIRDTMGGWPPRPGGIEAAMPLVTDEVLDLLTATGTPEMCRRKVEEYLEAGASCPVLCPLTANVDEIIETFSPA